VLQLEAHATRQYEGRADEWYYSGWVSWTCGGLYLGVTPAAQPNSANAFDSIEKALSAARYSLSEIVIGMVQGAAETVAEVSE
jgi:hypothetical protein